MRTVDDIKWYKPIRINYRSIDFLFPFRWILTICFKGKFCCYFWRTIKYD